MHGYKHVCACLCTYTPINTRVHAFNEPACRSIWRRHPARWAQSRPRPSPPPCPHSRGRPTAGRRPGGGSESRAVSGDLALKTHTISLTGTKKISLPHAHTPKNTHTHTHTDTLTHHSLPLAHAPPPSPAALAGGCARERACGGCRQYDCPGAAPGRAPTAAGCRHARQK